MVAFDVNRPEKARNPGQNEQKWRICPGKGRFSGQSGISFRKLLTRQLGDAYKESGFGAHPSWLSGIGLAENQRGHPGLLLEKLSEGGLGWEIQCLTEAGNGHISRAEEVLRFGIEEGTYPVACRAARHQFDAHRKITLRDTKP